MYLGQIARAVNGSLDRPINGERVRGVSTDTRTLRPGDVFFALRGPNYDGHDYVGEAFRRGAAVAVVERPARSLGPLILVDDARKALGRLAAAYRLTLRARVAAVTGSNGKTTAQGMIARILEGAGTVVKPPGSFNNIVGLPRTLLSAGPSTDYVVLELGTNAPGEIAALAEIARPDVGVVTSIGEAHLEGLGDIEGIAVEKASLFRYLRGGGTGVVRFDPRLLSRIRLPAENRITFGLTPEADLFPTELALDPLRFRVRGVNFRLDLYGRWNVENALAASAVGMVFGLPLEECARRLEGFRPPKMRMERLELSGRVILNDAYNSNPVSAGNAVEEFGRLPAARKVVIVGEMRELGPRSAELHRDLGRRIAAIAPDRVIAVGPGCGALAAEIPGALWVERVEEVRPLLPEVTGRGDWILLKGSRAVGLDRVVLYLGEID